MNIWLINPYGAIPGEGWREYRFKILGQVLAEHGFEVTWWSANFSHFSKEFRSDDWAKVEVNPNFQICLVPTTGYRRHIGLARLLFELVFAWRVVQRSKQLTLPDCIIAAEPSLSSTVGVFLKSRNPKTILIVDVIDLWPELFALALPSALRWLAPGLFFPLTNLRRRNLRNADAITAVCNSYLELAKRESLGMNGARAISVFWGTDLAAYRSNLPLQNEMSSTLVKDSDMVWAIYAGTLGNNYDIETLVRASEIIQSRQVKIKILVVGDGPLGDYVSSFVQSHPRSSLVYLGKQNTGDLVKYYQFSDIGICSYLADSTVAMPIKFFDYLAAGLPIVNSLRGELEDFLRDNQIGIQYEAGNPRALADALETLATDNDRRSMMARNSYDAAMQFDKNVQYLKFVNLVEGLLTGTKHTRSTMVEKSAA